MPNLEVCKGGSSDGRSSLSESGLRVSALTRLSVGSLNSKLVHIYWKDTTRGEVQVLRLHYIRMVS